MNGNSTNLIKEFKKQNNSQTPKSTVIDGNSNDQSIADSFSEKYKNLYQKNDSTNNLLHEINVLDQSINDNNFVEVENLSPSVVYQALQSLKNMKNDNVFTFKSDALIHGADILVKYFTLLFQSFLIHGYVPSILLTSTLQPIIKDKLGNKCSSDNYRAIGCSSLILKLLDKIILILFSSSLQLSEYQFGFQKCSSTSLCTWTVKETVNYFLNRNTPVFACFLDMTKAFDLVNYYKLFIKLKNKISPLFIRLLAFIYLHQKCDVSWNNCKSSEFNVLNGVKQGAVLSPLLFSVYINDLFDLLNQSGFGCYINNYFYGSVSYADDIVLLSPSVQGLQELVNISKNYFDSLDMVISLNINEPLKSKTKCLAFGSKSDPPPLKLGDNDILWTDSYTHLGHILTKDGTDVKDITAKMYSFIGKYHSLCQVLKHKDPRIYIKLINIYFCDFYGSNLWNLFSKSAEKFYTMWNKMVRFVFKLPSMSHRYLLEPLSSTPHLKTKLTDRFLKFHETVKNSLRPLIKNLYNLQVKDFRSDFGHNVQMINGMLNIDNLSFAKRGSVKYHPIRTYDEWRISILNELVTMKSNQSFSVLTLDELNDLITHVSCS